GAAGRARSQQYAQQFVWRKKGPIKKEKETDRRSQARRTIVRCFAGGSAASTHCDGNADRVAMRVIAGSAGGIRLAVPKRGVRPTMDRVKAAIFSSLGDAVAGARVLDLFAGSGVLVLEKRPAETLSEMQLWRLVRQKTYGTTEVLFLSAIRNRQLVRRSLGEGRSTIK